MTTSQSCQLSIRMALAGMAIMAGAMAAAHYYYRSLDYGQACRELRDQGWQFELRGDRHRRLGRRDAPAANGVVTVVCYEARISHERIDLAKLVRVPTIESVFVGRCTVELNMPGHRRFFPRLVELYVDDCKLHESLWDGLQKMASIDHLAFIDSEVTHEQLIRLVSSVQVGQLYLDGTTLTADESESIKLHVRRLVVNGREV